MHSDWDLVKMDLPARVFTPEYMTAKGQHHIVHFSSRGRDQATCKIPPSAPARPCCPLLYAVC